MTFLSLSTGFGIYKMKKILQSTSILGIPVDSLSTQEALNHIFTLVENFQTDQIPRYVATINVNFIANAHSWIGSKPEVYELFRCLQQADLNTADGMPLLWYSRLLGSKIKERVSGADLVPLIAQAATKKNKSLFLLGGKKETSLQAIEVLKETSPNLQIAGIDNSFIQAEENPELVKKINESKADILLINLGNPKQELWFNRNKHLISVPVSMGIGGTLSFISGDIKRAPLWVQKLSLEWVYRITQEPTRLWKRYFSDLIKLSWLGIPDIFYQKIYQLFHRQKNHKPFSVNSSNASIDLKNSKYINPNDLAQLIRQVEILRKKKADFTTCNLSKAVKRQLHLQGIYQSYLKNRLDG
jgi:N-acetylglucosaminyldiphosphoundecaprenol N-acetyl-beta-D-mannosaminyltransferase